MATFSVDITSVKFAATNSGYKDITITGMPAAGVNCSITGTDSSSFGYRIPGSDQNVYRVYTTAHSSVGGASTAQKTATFKITNLGDSSDYVEVSLEQVAYWGYARVVGVSTTYANIYPYFLGDGFGSSNLYFDYTGASGSVCEMLVDGYVSTTISVDWIYYNAQTTYTDTGFKRVFVGCNNNYSDARKGTISFSSDGNSNGVYQNGYPSSTSGCTSPISFTAAGGTERVTLHYSSQNVANLYGYWRGDISGTYTKTGSGNSTSYWDLTVPANTSSDAKRGIIYFQRDATYTFLGFTIINQDGTSGPTPTLSVDPAVLTYPSTGGARVLGVTYAAPLTTNESSMPSWLSSTYVQISGGERSYTITAAANSSSSSRDWNFEFTDANNYVSVPLTQEAGEPASLSISPTSGTKTSAGGSVSIQVSYSGISEINYMISGNWITYSSKSGTYYYFNCAANTSTSQRQGTITFYGGGLSQTYTLTQAGISSVPISANKDAICIVNGGGSGWNVTITYTGAVTISKPSWVLNSTTSITVNGTYKYTFGANSNEEGDPMRIGSLIFTGDNGTSCTVKLYQGGYTYGKVPVISPTSLSRFQAVGGSQNLVVDYNGTLTISNVPNWISVQLVQAGGTSASPSPPALYSVTASSNVSSSSTRSGSFRLQGSTGSYKTVYVSQDAGTEPSLSVTPSSGTVGNDSGSVQITVVATNTISYSISGGWVTYGSKSGNVYTFNYAANSTTTARVATITFSADGLTETYTLSQAAGEQVSLSVSPTSNTVGSGSGSVQMTVTSTGISSISYSITGNWITYSSKSGNVYTFNYGANTSTSQRTGIITFNGGGASATYTLTQSGIAVASISLSPASVSVGTNYGTTSTTVSVINPTSGGVLSYSIVSGGGWLSSGSSSGGTYTFNYATNSGTSSRTGVVRFSYPGAQNADFTVVQAGTAPVPVTSPSLKATPSWLRFYKESGRRYVSFNFIPTGGIDSSITYKNGSGWLTISDAGNRKSVVATANSGSARKATIRFYDHNDSSNYVELKVVQGAADGYDSIWMDTLYYPQDRDADGNYFYDIQVPALGGTSLFRGISSIPPGWGGDIGGIDIPRLVEDHISNYMFDAYHFSGMGWGRCDGYITVDVINMDNGWQSDPDATFKYWNDWSRFEKRYDYTRYLNDPINGKGCDNMIIPISVYYDDAATFSAVETEISGVTNTYTYDVPEDPFMERYDSYYNCARVDYKQDDEVIFSYDMTHCGDGVLVYRNRFGGWDSFLIEGNIIKTDEYKKQHYRKKGEYNQNYNLNSVHYRDEKYTDSVDITGTYQAYTGWLTDEEAQRLTFHLLSSPIVYFQDLKYDPYDTEFFTLNPVRLTGSSAEYKKFKNGKRLVNYLITFEVCNIQKVRD